MIVYAIAVGIAGRGGVQDNVHAVRLPDHGVNEMQFGHRPQKSFQRRNGKPVRGRRFLLRRGECLMQIAIHQQGGRLGIIQQIMLLITLKGGPGLKVKQQDAEGDHTHDGGRDQQAVA